VSDVDSSWLKNQADKQAVKYDKATPVALADYQGEWLMVEDEIGRGAAGEDGFVHGFEALCEAVYDKMWDEKIIPADSSETELMIAWRISKLYIYACKVASKHIDAVDIVQNMMDEYHDGAWDEVSGEALNELQAFLDKWTEANVPDSYEPDYSRKIVIGQ